MRCGKLVFKAPCQSWGIGNVFTTNVKKTSPIPTLSGVCGLIGNSQLYGLEDPRLIWLENNIHLYFDESQSKRGVITTEFHVCTFDKYKANGSKDSHKMPNKRVERIDNAKFVLYYYFDDERITEQVAEGLKNPRRYLYLGRKCYPAGKIFDRFEDVDVSKLQPITKVSSYWR